MDKRLDELLLTFLLLGLVVSIGIDRFIIESPLTRFITSLLIGMSIVGAFVYVYRMSLPVSKHR